MVTIPEALAIALEHHQGGQLQAAEQIYRQILQADPNQVDAIHLLGVLALQVGQYEMAVEYIGRAIALKGHSAAFHNNLGEAYRNWGKIPEAAACYRRALELNPDFAEAQNNLGVALNSQGKLDDAIACYRRALELKPDYAEAQNNLGNALKDQGHLDEAVACYRRTLELNPHVAETHYNLGIVSNDQGKLDEAVACYRRALELRLDYAEAYNNLGNALHGQSYLDEAAACYRRALELKPDYAEACYNLGNALDDQGNLDEAAACYRRALDLKPDYAASLGSLVHTLQHLCRWDDFAVLSQRVIDFVDRNLDGGNDTPLSPFTFLALPTPTTAKQQLRCARQWVDRQLKAIGSPGRTLARRRPSAPKPKTTIGYLSSDFYSHATAWLIAELIEKHDRDRFAIFGYSYGPDDGSPTRRRLVNAFDRFVDVKDASFAEAAERIAADEVDILVDLKGYTKNARTQILALRPAPIQVNYLGYPGTLGAEFIDYILVDDFVVPPGQQPYFSEKLVHLPGCYQVNDSRREIAAQTPSRTECGLPDDGFVWCCFNHNYKITPEVFAVWMDLLAAVPGSVLWLLEGNRFVRGNLCREAQARGIAAERLVFAPHRPLPWHLARHHWADLFLDTFPVNAHTTASDALWTGCPVLTLAGETFVSRVAGSLLSSVGLSELITHSLDDYRAMALRLAGDASLLAGFRTRLAANRQTSPLFDAGPFARNIEKAYTAMWAIYASGERPRTLAVRPT
jgi:protein O-GlcNAc transferase